MRVNPNLTNEMLSGISLNRHQSDEAINELSTGRKVNKPSDDPAAVASLILNKSRSGQVNSYLSNVSCLQSIMQVASSTLGSVVSALSKASSLAVQGANGTLNQSDREAIAEEVDGIRQEVLSYANESFQGNYLFAGTAVNTQPFVPDPASSSGVSYKGNDGVSNVDIGSGQTVPANLPGSQIFTSSTANVFQALTDLSDALRSGSGIKDAGTEVQHAFNYVNTQNTFYGTTMSRLETAQTFLNEENVQLSETDNNLAAADMATAATQMTQAEVALEATLAAGSKIASLNLFDYLK
jgi:flagellar hook-associated protein 3 FlgL